MAPELPLIIDNFGDVLVFRSLERARGYLEAIDVENNEYTGYDAAGRLLSLGTEGERVLIGVAEEEAGHSDDLRRLLIRHLIALRVPLELLQNATLPHLIATRLRYETEG